MRSIAREETAHAQLSFRIAAWARSCLGARDVRALDRARRAAYASLCRSLGYRPGDGAAALGWPSDATSAAMLDALAPLLAS
jgi:hypothetical protein